MNGDEQDPLEEEFTSMLAACDEALAQGSAAAPADQTPPELRQRLERGAACLRLLGRLWPGPAPASGGTSVSAERTLTPSPLAAEPPARLGRFEIRRELGRGGFGVVFLAYDPGLDREVALKVPRPDILVSPKLRERFQREARAAAGLDHLHVVGVYEAGEVGPVCYIASAYCPGPTLAEWLREHKDGVPARLAAQLVAVLAHAVQHAHSRGVLHRDLKPSNVLLAPIEACDDAVGDQSGAPRAEYSSLPFFPKVADFGLARLLDDDEGTSVHACQTESGAVVGTPSYMAPEQAAGRDITTAVDVYALGAILYEALTGRPPFQAASLQETLEKVRQEEPQPPRRLRRDLPRDLETICLKCLHKELARRYASAHALAEDLERFLAGTPIEARPVGLCERGVKWARRRPASAALVGVIVAAVLTVGTGTLWYNAQLQDALQTAEDRGIEAREKHVKARANFLKARSAVDKMLTEVGEVHLAHVPQMELVRRKLLQEALAIYQDFLNEETDDPVLRQETGRAHYRVANIYQWLGQHTQAEEAYGRAQKLHEQLAREFPDDFQYKRDLAASTRLLGNLLWQQGKLAAAESAFRQVVSLSGELAARFRDGLEDRWNLAKAYTALAIVLEGRAKLPDSEKAHGEALTLYRELVAQFPGQIDIRLNQAGTQINLGLLLTHTKRDKEARETFRQALTSLEQWTGADTDRPQYRSFLARGYANLGTLLTNQKRFSQAEQAYRQAIAAGEKLTSAFPATPAYRESLAHSCQGLGLALQRLGQSAGAEQAFRQAVDHQNKLVEAFPRFAPYRQNCARFYTNWGLILRDQAGLRQGALEEAGKALTSSLELRKQLLADFPGDAAAHNELGGALHNLALVSSSKRQWPETRKLLEQAVAQQCAALNKDPKKARYREFLVQHLMSLAEALRETGDPAESLKVSRRGYALCEALLSEFPGNPTHHANLGAFLNNEAQLFMGQGQWAQARPLLNKAIVHQQAALEADPKNPTFQGFLLNHHLNLAETALNLGDYGLCAHAAKQLPRLAPGGWEAHYRAAKLLVRSALSAGEDPGLSQEKKDNLRKQYADRGLALLREAVERGFNQAATLRHDPAFHVLHSRSDFESLVGALERRK